MRDTSNKCWLCGRIQETGEQLTPVKYPHGTAYFCNTCLTTRQFDVMMLLVTLEQQHDKKERDDGL